MAKRREPTDGELALWSEVMRDVRRTQKRKRSSRLLPAESARKLKEPATSAAAPRHSVAEKKPRQPPEKKNAGASVLDGSTLRRLKQGKVAPDAKLDLHGLTQAQAHNRLATFLHRAFDQDMRCVLVVTGKGGGRVDGDRHLAESLHHHHHGILKSMVPRWLNEGDIKRFVSGTADAHVRHGGAGAVYVYLRRRKSAG